ncbi:MAG: hypothetical protein AAF600_04830 [Bacteroidota bacterium]
MDKELPSDIQSTVFQHPIWGLLHSEKRNSLLVDCRNENKKQIEVYECNMKSLVSKKLEIEVSWLEKMIGCDEDMLYSLEYKNVDDPTLKVLKRININTKKVKIIDALPVLNRHIKEALLFKLDSQGHQTIADYLALKLELSCEYLEFTNNIVISYYLRSGEAFDRFLLLIKDGKKKWKVRQDHQMKGFSSGAFFVVEGKLVFVKDRNEVCIYSL